MKTVAQKGKYELHYDRYIDDMGFEKDSFSLFDTERRVHRPFWGFPKVSDKDGIFPINRIPYEYTQKDFDEMLDEQLNKP